MVDVSYIGLNALSTEEADVVRSIVEKHAPKLARKLEDTSMRVHVKLHEVQGRKKYSLHAHVNDPRLVLIAEAVDWDLHRVSHMLMDKLMNEMKKKMKLGGQKQERFHPKSATKGKDSHLKAKVRGL